MLSAHPIDRCRNIGILASQDAGRTTTTERMLTCAAAGLADAKAAEALAEQLALPGFDDLHELAISVTAAATSCEWRGALINIVELAGHDRAAAIGSVVDGVVLVVDGSAAADGTPGLPAGSPLAGAARLAFVNKLDRMGNAPASALAAAVARLDSGVGAVPVAIQLPYSANAPGLIDLVRLTAVEWHSGARVDAEVPEALLGIAQDARRELASLIDADAEADADVLVAALRAAVIDGRVMPVLCGSAYQNRGIDLLLDAAIHYLPAPSDLGGLLGRSDEGATVERAPSEHEPFSAVAFGTLDEPGAGTLTFMRVFSGTVSTGGSLLNTVSAGPERIGRMVRLHANSAEDIGEARAGDIVAVAGLQHTALGDTLCDPANPLVVEHFPLTRMPAAAGRTKH